ncbi:MAG: DMT family transporter [Candidatus Aminicenantia bacterium]
MLTVIFAFISSFLWSTSFPMIKYALSFSNPIELLFVRFFFASIFALFIGFFKRRDFKFLGNRSFAFLGILNALGFLSQFIGQKFTSSSNASVISNTSIIFTAILAVLILKERFSLRKGVAGLLTFAGIIGISTGFKFSFSPTLNGDLLILISAICWAIFTISNKVVLSNKKAGDVVLGVMVWTFIFLLPYSLFLNSNMSFKTVLVGLYLSIFCSIVPLYFFNLALKRFGAYSTVIFLSTEIIFAVSLSILFLGEKLNFPFVLGCVLVMAGIFLNPQD